MTDVRDVKGEGDQIKQAVTQSMKKFDVNISSISEILTPNFSVNKIIPNQKVEYIPDFYYLMNLANKTFNIFRTVPLLRKMDHFDIFGYELYCGHCAMYFYLKCLASTSFNIPIISNTIQLYETAGFDKAKLPIIFLTWFQSIGKHSSAIYGIDFVASIVDLEQDHLTNGGFFEYSVGHLLPNFIAYIRKSCFLVPEINIGMAANLRTIQNWRNIQAAGMPQWLVQINLARTQERKIPGLFNCRTNYMSRELRNLLTPVLDKNYGNHHFLRYLQYDRNLFEFLVATYSNIIDYTDHFIVGQVSTIGSELIECVSRDFNFGLGSDRESINEDGDQLISTIVTKRMVTDGYAMKAAVLPIVRLSNANTRIQVQNIDVEEPQDDWFTHGLLYESAYFTPDDSHNRISKK